MLFTCKFVCYQLMHSFYMMTVLHTHYVVDYIGAVAAVVSLMTINEKVSHITDVKLQGLPAEKRGACLTNRFCSKCGWPNLQAAKFTNASEVQVQK